MALAIWLLAMMVWELNNEEKPHDDKMGKISIIILGWAAMFDLMIVIKL